MILKGQNFRLLSRTGTNNFKVFAKSTSCTVNLTGNTDDASHKDVLGMAAMPTIVSKAWSLTVDSLEVTDYDTLLSMVRDCVKITVEWDETGTTDNQTPQAEAFSRRGEAYINDMTLVFNDREISTKNLQMTGTGALQFVDPSEDYEVISVSNTFIKGESVRLFLGAPTPNMVVAAAKQLSFHVNVSMESSTTKDTATGDWDTQEPTAVNFDISTSALLKSGETITSTVQAVKLNDFEDIFNSAVPVPFQIARVSGANNRTKGDLMVSGNVILTQLTINGPNRANADYSAQMQGYGTFTIHGSALSNSDMPDSGNL
jgi:hypothetical protein